MADEKNGNFTPGGFDPSKIDFSKIDFSKMPPPPPMQPDTEGSDATPDNNLLTQADPETWLRQPPKKIRGDMRKAFKYAGEAETYNCNCWNKQCPFHGNCRKCIVFHMALKQVPTCQRDMLVEMIKDGTLSSELYVTD